MERLDMEKLNKAIIYVERISEGKNPVNNMPAENDTVLNDPNVIRCMYFIKDALVALKKNGGEVGRTHREKKKPFPLETLESFEFVEIKTVSKLTEQLNENVDTNEYQKLKYNIITGWLKKNGYLTEIIEGNGKKKFTISTEKGQDIGITHSLQTNASGMSYYRVEYDKNAQEFVVNNLVKMFEEQIEDN
jgi:hypothetical protein